MVKEACARFIALCFIVQEAQFLIEGFGEL
jgi:hypothetical protein